MIEGRKIYLPCERCGLMPPDPPRPDEAPRKHPGAWIRPLRLGKRPGVQSGTCLCHPTVEEMCDAVDKVRERHHIARLLAAYYDSLRERWPSWSPTSRTRVPSPQELRRRELSADGLVPDDCPEAA